MKKDQWTVREAKTHLSEIMRRSREEGPQKIGTRNGCIVVSEKEWNEHRNKTKVHMGKWIVENFRGAGELELPERGVSDRPPLFTEEDEAP